MPKNVMNFEIKFETEDDGRWIAEIQALPGAMAYGATRKEAKVQAIALRIIAEQYEQPFARDTVA